ncbi:hypothetical protein BJ546DRAFT_947515 [Cryomyces antarcticus]
MQVELHSSLCIKPNSHYASNLLASSNSLHTTSPPSQTLLTPRSHPAPHSDMDSAQEIASAAWTTMITPATGTFALEIQAMKYIIMILAAALVGTFMTVASPAAAAICIAALITPFGLISGLAELVRYLLFPSRTPKERDDEENGRHVRFVVGTALLGVPHFVKVVYLVISKVEEREAASSIVTAILRSYVSWFALSGCGLLGFVLVVLGLRALKGRRRRESAVKLSG